MAVDVIIGLQRGDEGKGRFVDLVAPQYAVIARGNGGANAGHTIMPDNMPPIALHQVPSGIVYPDKLNIIGNGVYLDPRKLRDELSQLEQAGVKVTARNLLISLNAHLVLPHHVLLDELREAGPEAQGSTKSGIAYVASDKYLREGIRLESAFDSKQLYTHAIEGLRQIQKDKSLTAESMEEMTQDWIQSVEALKPFIADTVEVINQKIQSGDDILVEGAQAFGLDIDHGMYPYVTSSSTTVSGLLEGLGIAPKYVNKVTGIAKVIKSHVGGGPFVTEIEDEALASRIRGEAGVVDSEYGSTTKRPRRVGYPDLPELRSAIMVNGVNELALTKLDHVSRFGSDFKVAMTYSLDGQERQTAPGSAITLQKCKAVYQTMQTWGDISLIETYEQLPNETKEFVSMLEANLEVPVRKLGIGPGRKQVIFK